MSDIPNYFISSGVGLTKAGKLSSGGVLIAECIPGQPGNVEDLPYDFNSKDRCSKFVNLVWNGIEEKKLKSSIGNSTLGNAFENLIALVCYLEKLSPFHLPQKLARLYYCRMFPRCYLPLLM